MSTLKPFIGIAADRRLIGEQWFHGVAEKYLVAVAQAADAFPVLLPALGEGLDLNGLLTEFDGLLLTGSPSNVEPHRYGGPASEPGTLHDPQRDATTLPLIPAAVQAGLPVLGVCRGFQEMNVAFGGSLHQKLHQVPGFQDHREDLTQPLDKQYGPAHEVMLTPGGQLHGWAGSERLMVNSLHGQGVERLGTGLTIEARAPDGVIEAFRVTAAPRFAFAVQWHPEWRVMENEFSKVFFARFGEAARERLKERLQRRIRPQAQTNT